MAYYSTGSITVTLNSATVTGLLTAFLANVKSGDTLHRGGVSGVVRSVESNTSLTLEKPWGGPNGATVTDWLINHTGGGWHTLVTINEQVVKVLNEIDLGFPFKADSSGTLANRATYDAKPKGWTYLRTDVTPFLLYAKVSDVAADWSSGSDNLLANDRALSEAAAASAVAAASQVSLNASQVAADKAAAATSAAQGLTTAGLAENYRGLAREWADKDPAYDITGEPGKKSARTWALQALAAVSQIQAYLVAINGNIGDFGLDSPPGSVFDAGLTSTTFTRFDWGLG
jgi:hypothetical protein